jgi:hypothetical protein
MNIDISKIVRPICEGIEKLYELMDKELSQDWKTYTITINDVIYELDAECDPALRKIVIKQLLKDAINAYIDSFNDGNNASAFNVVEKILNGSRKEDHQFEIITEKIVSNLDEDSKPITAKPLNVDSVLVQWQDQNKFPSFDEYARTRFTDEELESIEKEAHEELDKFEDDNV